MSGQDRKDFDDRLAELNSWQIEQQRKLKAFQEAQRKLLDLEHKNVLNSLNTQNCGERVKETSSESQNLRRKEIDGIFQFKFPEIKLTEPKSLLFNPQKHSQGENFVNACTESPDNEEDVNKPKKFLRRGEGLARFRMTLDDFKGPPKIYKENRIKTYLNGKPEPKTGNQVRSSKSNTKCNRISVPKAQVKPAPLPVKIYVPEKKPKQFNAARSSEGNKSGRESKNCKKLKQFCRKAPIENLALKPHAIATEWYNVMKEKEKLESRNEILEEKEISAVESDIENKKDEKELRIFEILEKKVDETSFCSNSSFVDKLMEQSNCSTPSKLHIESREICATYAQGLKSLRSKFLDEEQIKKFEDLDKIPLEIVDDGIMSEHQSEHQSEPESEHGRESPKFVDLHKEPEINQTEKPEFPSEAEKQPEPRVNKTLLQEYIKDFKKFKFMLAENSHRLEEQQSEKEPSPKELMKDEQEQTNPHEIALTLRRKGLQDNVKQLLNWDCPTRKRQPKRVVKKIKSKPKLEKSKSVSKEQGEKIVFNSSLLNERLNELEKEIDIFRKENRNLEKLQKECNEERIKLSREKKEFEKQMQEEKEKLEARMAEEQKKLQKEKTVFEKYCKQVKNQPTRQEREETAKLKKEIDKLMETLSTKETRWGANQARLRNQIKALEKDNSQLKTELEKYKKLTVKRVSFENEKILNTKIIHVINSELGKLKPTVVKNIPLSKNQSLSARDERVPGERPIRRIKSAPNVKRQLELDLYTEGSNDCDEKALGSVSTDSGIETNGSRYPQRGENVAFREPKVTNDSGADEPCKGSQRGECIIGRKSDEVMESVVREAIFPDDMDETSRKIAEVKNRLGRLNFLGRQDENPPPVRMVKIPSSHRSSESEEEGSSSMEEDDEDDEGGQRQEEGEKAKDLEILNCSLKKRLHDSYSSSFAPRNFYDSKIEDKGIWEKLFDDGSKEINYPNGNVKKIFPGSKIVRMTYYNGDVKETNVVEGSEKYYYAETKTWHTTYKDGLEVLEFPNGQTERRHADGSTEISFPNGCVRYCDSAGKDEWRFLDGTVIKTNECGHKILLMPNGQKEIHTKEFKRREYPDGTVKIVYPDGTQETRYSTGRVRLKDKDGNLMMDSGGIR